MAAANRLASVSRLKEEDRNGEFRQVRRCRAASGGVTDLVGPLYVTDRRFAQSPSKFCLPLSEKRALHQTEIYETLHLAFQVSRIHF